MLDFGFTDDELRFRDELRAFLDQELPDWWRGMFVDDDRAMPFTRSFCKKLAERGWLTMAWPREHGGPVRMITPKLYAWKGAKWIRKIEFLAEDRPGFWEVRGYSNTAEPWYNDRYSTRPGGGYGE